MCPNCGKLLTYADKDDPNLHKLACKHCRKWIWYYPNDDDKMKPKKSRIHARQAESDFTRSIKYVK